MEDFLDKRSEGVKYAAFKEVTERRAELGAQLDAETGLALALAKHRTKRTVNETRQCVFSLQPVPSKKDAMPSARPLKPL